MDKLYTRVRVAKLSLSGHLNTDSASSDDNGAMTGGCHALNVICGFGKVLLLGKTLWYDRPYSS
jgi:hypothetical protein